MPRHLIRRGDTWHVKVAIPADIQPVFGKRVFQQSLQTSDINIADAKKGPLVLQFKKLIANARGNPTEQLDEYLMSIQETLKDARREEVNEDTIFAIQQEVVERLARAQGVQNVEDLKPSAEAQVLYKFKIADGQLTPFEEHLEKYIETRKVETTTIKKDRHTIPKFAATCPMLEDVSKKKVRDFVKQLSVDEGLSNTTIKDNLSTLRTFWKWLANEDLVDAEKVNPFADVPLPEVNRKATAEGKRLPFTVEEIKRLSKVIEGGRSEMMKATFTIAIYTGCRLEEITSLEAKNVTEDEIKIVGAKTAAGNRIIPVHEELRSLIAELKGRGDRYLLPDLVTNKDGNRSPAMTKQFSKVKANMGFDGRKVLHSIRKTVSTQLEQAGVPESISADILGHEKKTMTYGVYSGGSSMEQKREAIMKLDYGLKAW